MRSTLKNAVEMVGDLGNKALNKHVSAELYDIKAMSLLPDLGVGYVPWSSFAIRPSALTMMLNELVMNDSRVVIECGIGMSTLYMLSSQTSDDIRVVGIDDDAEWIGLVTSYLQRMGVPSDRYCLIHAPIKDYGDDAVGRTWYDDDKIKMGIAAFLGEDKADMLVVDGPKGFLSDKSRYQALPQLMSWLKSDCSVFLDDIHREDEYEIGQLWSREFNLNITYHLEKGGIAILRPSDTRKDRTIT